MPLLEEEIVTVFVIPEDYAYHKNQVASVSTQHIRIIRKKFSFSTPYALEEIPIAACGRIDYVERLSPVRIVFGVLLVTLMLTIFYLIGIYGSQLEAGTTVRVGLLGLALVAGLRWTFMSRQHHMIFHLNDGSRLLWRSRSGDFKYKEWAVNKLLEHFKALGLEVNEKRAKRTVARSA